ncbi:hypothetical protein D9V37_03000 [Nocardioides mangrovicus]|uniref:Uncharacterized protein n=1 Tax=Nocardioides mangrovicus TaxID=2478913 RepID=A0A3L8P8A5_9ACTN|nr:hypothetical protein D9V37_03000 [Nocardioides mangrovicus]
MPRIAFLVSSAREIELADGQQHPTRQEVLADRRRGEGGEVAGYVGPAAILDSRFAESPLILGRCRRASPTAPRGRGRLRHVTGHGRDGTLTPARRRSSQGTARVGSGRIHLPGRKDRCSNDTNTRQEART